MSGVSNNSNNTGPTDSQYITEVNESHALRYWVPTSSKLSRGIKGTIQRVFTGEPLHNLCNVYIYNETSKSWFHEYTITGSSGEDFGRSLDGTDNADMVAIGAPGTWFGSVSTITGYVRVFTKDSSGNGWTQRGASVSQQGGFGHSVALSPYDGNILAVGAPFYNTLIPDDSLDIKFRSIEFSEGKVYIYKWNGTNYILQQTLNSPSGTLSTSITPDPWKSFYFGYSLGITDIGDKIIVGEPAIRNLWYEPHQLQGGASSVGYASGNWSTIEFPYTGNAHVYDNFTVLSGGTTWTSNVSITSVIGTTGIGTMNNLDSDPTRVRWLDALGTSVDINRAGTRILAGAPGSYGTSNTSPHAMSGRIYTLNWDPINAVWEEMGEVAKHIVAPQGNMLLGKTTRFDGSGRRIVTGATGYINHMTYEKGDILVYDWNGDQWVNFPGENVEIVDLAWNASEYWTNWQWKLGEAISIDGEGEMISFGVSEHKSPHASPTDSGVFRPNAFNVNNITYIGGATTSTAGSSSTVTTGSSNIWVYNIQQSMVVKGNVTVGGYVQATGMSIGTEDDSSTSSKSLFFGGSKSDNSYDLTVIENRVYDNEEKSELLIFKGNDNVDPTTGGGTYGPDRIRLKGGQIAFDLNAGYDRIQEDIRAVMHRNAGGAGMLGINVTAPTEVIHVDGKIKCTQGFIGKGTEITGIDLDYVIRKPSSKLNNQAGVTVNPIQLGSYTVNSTTTYPTVALSGNISNGYTVNASRDTANAYKAFNDNTSDYWEVGDYNVYSNGSNRGAYLGSTEKIAGYKGEWIELILPNEIFVTELQIYADTSLSLPTRSYTFGSNDGIEYYLIQDSGVKSGGVWNAYNTIFTRTPDTLNETPYNRILIIATSLGGGNVMGWRDINILGQSATISLNMKLDNTGKIGIGTTTPNYNLDVDGDINFTGELSVSGSVGASGQVLTTNGPGLPPTWTTVSGGGGGSSYWTQSGTNLYYLPGSVGIGTLSPLYSLDVVGDINLTGNIYLPGSVGIGTLSPLYSLDVDGDINLTGNVYQDGETFYASPWIFSATIPPPMTSHISGGYIVVGISLLNSGTESWCAFDGSSSTRWESGNNYLGSSTGSYHNNSNISTTYNGSLTVNGDWVQIETPDAIITNKIDILPYSTNTGQCPRTGKLLGSNDGSTWTEIHSFMNQTYTQGQYTTISFTNTTAYSVFRLVCEDMDYISSTYDPQTGVTTYYTTVIAIAEIRFYTDYPNIYFNTGKVGLGTAFPNYKLDVSGDVNFTGELNVNGSVGSAGQVLTSGGPGNAPTWTTVSSGSSGSSGYWSRSNGDVYYVSGFVGIGTTTPFYYLDVDGDINFTGDLFVNGSVGSAGQVLTSGGTGSTPTWTSLLWSQNGTDIYYTSGNASIGTTSTNGKLTVSGSNTGNNTSYRFFNLGTSQLTFARLSPSWSIYASNHIGASGFYAFSDRRIKKNITDINDSSALDKIRLLEPKMYNYINEVERGTSNVYGFIAQEVANVLPYAVTIGEGDIPNIYTNSNVIVTENSNVLELHLDTPVEGLSLSNTSVINIITDKDTTLTCNVLSFSGSNVITIENTDEFSNVTNAFIKGERITDFHSLDKNAIWAVATAALQEVDRQLQAEKTKVATLETQVADLLARVSVLENN